MYTTILIICTFLRIFFKFKLVILYKLSTLNQLLDKRIKFFKKVLNPLLKIKPQVKGVVIRCRIMTPRKPNSARRPIVKFSTKKNVTGGYHLLND